MVRPLVLAIVTAIASVASTMSLGNSERSKGSRRSEPIVFAQESRMVTSSADSSALFLLHLLKHKLKYQKIEKVPTTPPTADCVCVPYYLCDANNTVITDGAGAIDIRFRRCTGDLEVCCHLPSPTPSPIPTSIPTMSMAPIVTPTMPPTTPTTMPTTPTTTMPTTTTTTTTTMAPTTTTTMAPTTTTTMAPTTTTTMAPTTTTTMAPTTTTTVTYPPIVFPTAETTPPTTTTPAVPTISIPINCVCVPAYQCSQSGVVITTGEGVINPRQQVYLCPNPDQVCCSITGVEFPTNPVIVNPIPSPQMGQTCLICGNVLPCNGVIVVPNTGVIDPRVPSNRKVEEPRTTCNSVEEVESSIPTVTTSPSNVMTSSMSTPGSLKLAGTANACYCVKTWLCLVGNDVSPDGAGIIDPRFTLCQSADEVCCRPEGIGEDRVGRILPAKEGAEVYVVNDPMPSPQVVCGIPDTTFAPPEPYPADTGRTYFAEFPWMVALFIKQPSSYLFVCGGSMINTRAVLTAAHCVDTRQDGGLIARFGQWDIKDNDEIVPFQEAVVETILIHPQYYKAGLHHDIAVLILASPVTYNINVKPICLPQQGTTFPAGKRCYATGWGRNAFEGQFQEELHKVDLPIIDRSDCQTRLRSTRLGPYFQLHGSFICAGGETNRDTCRGDGGGPLVCRDSTGPFIQAGIVSWGIGCGTTSTPAVYVSVGQHRQWIDQQLANYGAF